MNFVRMRVAGVGGEQKKEVFSVLWFKWCLWRQHCDSLSRSLFTELHNFLKLPVLCGQHSGTEHKLWPLNSQRGFSHFIGRLREVGGPVLSLKYTLTLLIVLSFVVRL